MTSEFEDIKNYYLAKGAFLTGYASASSRQQVCIKDILYVGAVGEKIFAYPKEDVIYSAKELSIKQMLVRKVIQFFLIELIVMLVLI